MLAHDSVLKQLFAAILFEKWLCFSENRKGINKNKNKDKKEKLRDFVSKC